MAKIIPLRKQERTTLKEKQSEEFQNLIKWTTEMNELLVLIEKSLDNTSKNAAEDINS